MTLGLTLGRAHESGTQWPPANTLAASEYWLWVNTHPGAAIVFPGGRW